MHCCLLFIQGILKIKKKNELLPYAMTWRNLTNIMSWWNRTNNKLKLQWIQIFRYWAAGSKDKKWSEPHYCGPWLVFSTLSDGQQSDDLTELGDRNWNLGTEEEAGKGTREKASRKRELGSLMILIMS